MLTGKVYKGAIGAKEKSKEAIPTTKLADATIVTPLLVNKDYKVIGEDVEFQRVKEFTTSAIVNFDKAKSNVKSNELKDSDVVALKEWLIASTSIKNYY